MTKDIPGSVVEFLYEHMKITWKSNRSGVEVDYINITEHNVDYDAVVEDIQCYQMNLYLKSQKTVDYDNEGEGKIIITFTLSEEDTFRYELVGFNHGMDRGIYSKEEDLFIKMLPINQYDNVDNSSCFSIRFYLREGLFNQIPEGDIKYEKNTNPFTYLFEQQAYDIIPKPEACSYLSTIHNIRTDGIVIGANIETHSFMLNDLGNNVTLLGGEIQRIDEAEKQDRKDIDHLNQIVQKKSAPEWVEYLAIALSVGAFVEMMYGAGLFVMRCCGRRICHFPSAAASAVESEATRPLIDGFEESLRTINESTEYSASAGAPDFATMTVDEIFDYIMNESSSEATFEHSEINALYSNDDILEVYKIRKITKFNRLSIFDSVIRIGNFMKIGKIQDNKLVPLLSFSPGIQFRYFIDKDNAIIIKGFTTNDESTWDANHVVLGNVFKEHLQNNYVLKTELPDDLINETQLTTKLNDYTLKEDLTDYRKTTDLEYSYEKHLTVINELAVLEPYESGYTYIIRTERGEFEFKDAEEHDNWVVVIPNAIIEWINEVDEIIMIYWYSQSYYPNQTFAALTSDYTRHNITQIKEVI
uniref:hypothetical protein n=1 Tax=Helicobacter typhlonius TaxID=76936 RepID=UPI002FE04829